MKIKFKLKNPDRKDVVATGTVISRRKLFGYEYIKLKNVKILKEYIIRNDSIIK